MALPAGPLKSCCKTCRDFHVLLTLPSELRPLCRRNPAALYNLLFASASQALLDFGRGELNAQSGLTAVLHTWTRDLRLHPLLLLREVKEKLRRLGDL